MRNPVNQTKLNSFNAPVNAVIITHYTKTSATYINAQFNVRKHHTAQIKGQFHDLPNAQTSDLLLKRMYERTSGGAHLMGNLLPALDVYWSSLTNLFTTHTQIIRSLRQSITRHNVKPYIRIQRLTKFTRTVFLFKTKDLIQRLV